MIFTLAAISLNWRSALFAFAALIFLGVFFSVLNAPSPRAWRVEVLGLAFLAVGLMLWTAGVN